MRSFSNTSTFVNATTPYYDLQTTLQRNLVSTGFSADALQYSNSGSFFRSKNVLRGEGFSGESLECSNSFSYFDANGGGVPPAFPPADPFPTTVTATRITINFSSQGSSGDPPATYGIYYGVVRPDTFVNSVNAFGSLYVSQLTNLLPATKYYFQAIAQNPQGYLLSGITEVTTKSVPPSPSPPSGAPTSPVFVSSTTTSLTIQFDVAGITGSPYPSFEATFNSIAFPATQVSGTIYQVVATGLSPATLYTCYSVAYNESGTELSVPSLFSTLPAPLVPPSGPPSIPSLISATTTTITIEFDVDGISGSPVPTYYADQGATQLTAVLTSGTKYQATAIGLQPGTSYSFTSSATNAAGTKTSGSASFSTSSGPSPPTSLQSIFVVDFLLFDGIQWVIGQQNIPDIGQWFLTGGNAGQIQGNTGQSVIPYLKSLQAQGCKILVSIGGGGLSQTNLNAMLSNVQNTAASICYALLSKGVGTNPLGFAKTGTPWADFAFDGLDTDIEGPNGYQWPDGSAQYNLIKAVNTFLPSTILTAAPQSANMVSPNAFGGNDNGAWYGFPSLTPSSTLANYNTSASTRAWMYPLLMSSCGLKYLFVQFYNYDYPNSYPGSGPSNYFVPLLAMWGFLVLQSHVTLGTGCKLILGFGTNDATPIWNQGTDAPALNTNITQANALITAETGFSSVTPDMWIAGWGAWNSPSANSVVSTIYSPSGAIPNLPAGAVMLWTNNSGSPSLNPGWTGPIVNSR